MRNSAFELLRIVSMCLIVLYHIIFYSLPIIPNLQHQLLLSAMLPTLHIGVILFCLISGYFGIKSTWEGLISLLMVIFVYNLPFIILA